MAVFARTKRVIVPLGDEAKARIFDVSGSDHSGGSEDGDSPCLSELVHDFLEDGSETEQIDWKSDSDRSDSVADSSTGAGDEILRLAEKCSGSDSDRYRNLLLAHVLRAAEAHSGLRSEQMSVFRRKITSFLRELGHDAAVCKSRWSSSGGVTAGSYECIDVMYQPTPAAPAVRYLVDPDFVSQFEIARPTPSYARVLQSLPVVFVGKEENLRTMVRVACEAAKRSLKSRGLSLPPWRKKSYLENKWLGPHRRITCSSLSAPVTPLIAAVSCRSIGFEDSVNSRLFIKTR